MSIGRVILRIFLVLVLVGMVAFGVMYWMQNQPGARLARADEHLKAGEIESAKIDYLTVLQVEPENIAAHRGLSNALLAEAAQADERASLPGVAKALEHRARAWELDPKSVEDAEPLLDAYVQLGRFDLAKGPAEAILEQQPDHAGALYVVAQRAVDAKKYDEANAHLDELPGEAADELPIAVLRVRTARGLKQDEQRDAALVTLKETLVAAPRSMNERTMNEVTSLYANLVAEAETADEADAMAADSLAWLEELSKNDGAKQAAERSLAIFQPLQAKHPVPAPSAGDEAGTSRTRIADRVLLLGRASLAKEEDPLLAARLSAVADLSSSGDAVVELANRAIENAGDGAAAKPRIDQLRLMVAQQQIEKRRFREAEAELAQIERGSNVDGMVALLQGVIAKEEGRLEEAIEFFNRAGKLKAPSVPVRFGQAASLIGLGKYKAALPLIVSLEQEFDKLSAEDRELVERLIGSRNRLRLITAQLFLALDRFPEADKSMSRLKGTELEPLVAAMTADYHWRSGMRARAMLVLEDARVRFPDDDGLLRLQIGMLTEEDRVDEAQRLVDRMLKDRPDDRDARLIAFRWLNSRGLVEESVGHLDAILAVNPEDGDVLLLKGYLLLSLNRTEPAIAIAEQLVANPATEDRGNVLLAVAGFKTQNLDAAAAALQATSGRLNRGGESLLGGNLALARGDYNAAVESLSEAMQFTQSRSAAMRILAKSLSTLAAAESPAAAEVKVDELLDQYPDEPLLYLVKAEMRIRQGDFGGAEKRLQDFAKRQPGAVPHVHLAKLWLLQNDPVKGMQELRRALDIDPNNEAARVLATRTALQARDNALALSLANDGLERNEDSSELKRLRAVAFARDGRVPLAGDELEALMKANPTVPSVYVDLATVRRMAKDDDGALAALELGLSRIPGNTALLSAAIQLAVALDREPVANRIANQQFQQRRTAATAVTIGRSFQVARKFDAAATWATRAIELAEDDDDREAQLLLADVNVDAGLAENDREKIAAARATYEEMLEADPAAYAVARVVMGLYADRLNDLPAAVAVAERTLAAVELKDVNGQFLARVLDVYGRAKSPEEVLGFLDEVIAARPGEVNWRLAKVDRAAAARQYEVAFDVLDDLERLEPNRSRAPMMKARLRMVEGKTQQAISQAGRAVQRNPNDLEAQSLLIELQLQSGDNEAALARASAVLGQVPTATNIALQTSRALVGLGRTKEAIEGLEELVRLRPEETAARLQLADLLHAAQRDEEAVRLLEAGRTTAPRDLSLLAKQIALLLDTGDRKAARELATEAIGEEGTYAENLGLGRSFHAGDDLAAADEWAARAQAQAETDAQKTDVVWLRANMALKRGQQTDDPADWVLARSLYEELLADHPEHIAGANNLAWLMLEVFGEPARAEAVLTEAAGEKTSAQLPDAMVDTMIAAAKGVGDFERALALNEHLVTKNAGESRWSYQRAGLLIDAGRPQAGTALLLRMPGSADDPTVHITQLAKLWADRGVWHRVAAILESDVETNDPLSRALLARARVAGAEYDEGRRLAEASLALDAADNWTAEEAKALALVGLDRREEALAYLAGVVERAPSQAEPRFLLARLLDESGRTKEAIELLRAGLEGTTDQLETTARLVTLLARNGEVDEATRVADELASEAEAAFVLTRLSRAFLDANLPARAVEWGRRAEEAGASASRADVDRVLAESLLFVGRLDGDRSQLDDAAARFARVVEASPRSPAVVPYASLLAEDLAKPEEAKGLLEAARTGTAAELVSADLLRLLASLEQRAERSDEAFALLKEAVATHPNDAGLQFAFGTAAAEREMNAIAETALSRALQLGLKGAERDRAEAALKPLQGDAGKAE